MTIIVCMPVDDEYFKIGDEIYDLLQDRKAPPQTKKVSRAAELLVDAMLETMINQMVENVKMKPFAKKIIAKIEVIIQKAANALVHKVILKLNNKELWPLVKHLRELEVELEGKRYLSFQLEKSAGDALNVSDGAIEKGDLSLAKRNFHIGLQSVIDQGLFVFYKEPMSFLKLGIVARKIVDFGYTAIHGAVKPACKKIVNGMDLEELKSLKDYIDTITVEID